MKAELQKKIAQPENNDHKDATGEADNAPDDEPDPDVPAGEHEFERWEHPFLAAAAPADPVPCPDMPQSVPGPATPEAVPLEAAAPAGAAAGAGLGAPPPPLEAAAPAGAAAGAGPDAPPPLEAAAPAGAAAGAAPAVPPIVAAPKGARKVIFDGQEFTELHPGGILQGYSIECLNHDQCVRDCSFGKRAPMSPAECRRRLLAWRDDVFGEAGELISMPEHKRRGGRPLLANY